MTLMAGLRARGLSVVLVAGLAAAGIAGCSSGSSTSSTSTTAAGHGPEMTNVTVEMRRDDSSGGVWIAQQDGFFKQQGLNVTLVYPQSTSAEFPDLQAHTAQFVEGNYTALLQAMKNDPSAGFRIVADNVRAGANTNDLMVAANSNVTSVAQLKGKSVAFPGPGLDSAVIALDQLLKGYGISPTAYNHVAMKYSAMAGALKTGEVAAAFAVQPFITEMEAKDGDHRLVDLMAGPMLSFPLDGWITTSYYVQHDPRTIAAFQRALAEGQNAAAADPTLVRQLMLKHIKTMTSQIANVMSLRTYSNVITASQLYRLVVAMQQFGGLPASFTEKTAAQLIVPLPSGA